MKPRVLLIGILVLVFAACTPLVQIDPSGDAGGSGPAGTPLGDDDIDTLLETVDLELVESVVGSESIDDVLSRVGAGAGDQFGLDVAISDEMIVIGAPGSDLAAVDSGAAYVYALQASGEWSLSSVLLPSDAASGDEFGYSVGISGDAIIVGSRRDADEGANTGSAYVFRLGGGGSWTEEAKLVASDAEAFSEFGFSVDIDGDIAVVGAVVANASTVSDTGVAYLFSTDGSGSWTEVARLVASDAAESDQFGYSVAVLGDTLVVGSRLDDDAGESSGSAYVFSRDIDGGWSQRAKLVAPDAAGSDQFGFAVDIDEDTIAIGAILDDDGASNAGSAYLFDRTAMGSWSFSAKIGASQPMAADLFGSSVALGGGRLLVGAPGSDADDLTDSGLVYLFVEGTDGSWTEESIVAAPARGEGDQFGYAVDLESVGVAAAPFALNGDGADSGQVYIISFDDPCTTTLLDLVIRDGVATVAYEGSDAGRRGSGLRLTSMGKLYDEMEVAQYTVWRIRNSSNETRLVTLDGYGSAYAEEFSVPANTELFVRSPIASGAATHRLFEDGAQIDVKASSQSSFSDDREVTDPDC